MLVVVFVNSRFDPGTWVDEVWMPDLTTTLLSVNK